MVLFRDFADSALLFELRFWIRMRSLTDCWLVESDVRHTVDGLLRAAGLEIAFPQQDVHLDTSEPLKVKIISQDDDEDRTPAVENE